MVAANAEKLERVGAATYVIYHRPSDIDAEYVCRAFVPFGPFVLPSDQYATADTLDAIREKLPAGLTRIPRFEGDDPVIVESWV